MVKPLSFKGEKKPKKRKRAANEDQEGNDNGEGLTTKEMVAADVDAGEDDSWTSAELAGDVAGPVVFALPTEPPTCIACDANGKVFTSPLENIIEGDIATAEPHDVRQVWVANRVAGTEFHSFKGHHGRSIVLLYQK